LPNHAQGVSSIPGTSICIDRSMSMFGTVNLDMRSLRLNYELALFAYEPQFGEALRALQQSYVEHSVRLIRQSGQLAHSKRGLSRMRCGW